MVILFFVDDIPGFEGDYAVTEEGDVYSFKRNRFLKSHPDSQGYLQVTLHKTDRVSGARGKHISVHRVVALTFIPNPDNLPCVDHIDRNKRNNCVNNLRWVTYKQNHDNKSPRRNSSSKYKGVRRNGGKWESSISVDGNKTYLGRFASEEDAAVAYNNAVDRFYPGSEFHYKNTI